MSPSRLVVAAALAGVAVSVAPAAAVDLPPVPQPTVPAVTVPAITTPTVTVPVPAPAGGSSPVRPATVPAATAPTAPTTADTAQPASAGAQTPVRVAGSPTAQQRARTRTTPRAQRSAPRVATFRLGRQTALRILVLQQAPVCRRLGRYIFRATRGANTLRAPKRLHGHRLGVGTYLFVGAAPGRRVFETRIRLATVDSVLVARRTRLRDTCAARVELRATSVGTSGAQASPPEHATSSTSGSHRGVYRPAPLSAFNPANAPSSLRPLLYVLLAAAICLLTAAAAVPTRAVERGAAAGVVVRHRTTVLATGLGLLVAAAAVTVLT